MAGNFGSGYSLYVFLPGKSLAQSSYEIFAMHETAPPFVASKYHRSS
jgi:hypothetical protein